jgi:SSS family solute:Na+ symporter
VNLSPVDYVILGLYFLFVIGIGWRLRKSVTSAGEFLTAGHHVPVWITSPAFLAANLGAQEVVGMSASGAQ